MAFRTLPALASRRLAAAAPRVATASSVRFQSSTRASAQLSFTLPPLKAASTAAQSEDPKQHALRLIDAIPGDSAAAKTGVLFLGTTATAYAISEEIISGTDEDVLLLSFGLFFYAAYKYGREPFNDWADGVRNRWKSILEQGREQHLSIVQNRRDTIGQLQDVSGVTEEMFDMARETVEFEAATYMLRQQAAFDGEVKSVLDSWVRYEAQEREGKQRELVRTVIANVREQLQDDNVQKQILDQAITDISGLVERREV